MILIHFKLNWLSPGIFFTKYQKIFEWGKQERKKRITLFQLLSIIIKFFVPLMKEENVFGILLMTKVFYEICGFTCHQNGLICRIVKR